MESETRADVWPRGIERVGKHFRVIVSVSGRRIRIGKILNLEAAIVERDRLDAMAEQARDDRKQTTLISKKPRPRSVISLYDVATLGMSPSVATGKPRKSTMRGISSIFSRGQIKYVVRRWVDGKSQYAGTHDTLEKAVIARDAVESKSSTTQ